MPAAAQLQDFVRYVQDHIRGDEKSEAQSFLNRWFRAFGYEGAIEAGAVLESRLTKGSAKGNMGFADLVWRSRLGVPGVVVEMKSRREDLNKHYSQLERYWMRITPNRPRYAMLCNFDEFWIFDFENQVDDPVDKIALEQLPERVGALSFMEIGGQKPVFNNNQVAVTERTARRMGELYQLLYARGKRSGFSDFDEEQLQRFILQCVMAMFSEDRELLPRDLFVSLIQDCLAGKENTYDSLGGLFRAMNTKGITPTGRYKSVQYFNGGLFATVEPIELTPEELKFLDVCARDDWSNVRPSIFGNIFEGAIASDLRHAHGIHFTSEVDIRQIVRPTISDYWEEKIDSANTISELRVLQLELQSYRVLDPACGSGNFLYFPQTPTHKLIDQIRTTTQTLHQYRTDQMEKKQWGITTLYNKFFDEPTSQLYKLHCQLDALVVQAYGFSSTTDLLTQLLQLNLELADRETQGKPVIGAWAPDRRIPRPGCDARCFADTARVALQRSRRSVEASTPRIIQVLKSAHVE